MANNEFVVKNGLIVSGSTNVSGSIAATSFTGSFSGSIAAPGLDYDFPQNIGGVLSSLGALNIQNVGGDSVVRIGQGIGNESLRLIGPNGTFLTTNGPTGVYRFTQGQQYIELNDQDQTLRLAAGGTVIATVDSLSQGMGVGINAPTARLHIKGTGATSSTTALRVENANTSASLIVLDDGKVGVNTSSPTQTLQVNGSIGFDGNLYHTTGEIITQYQENFSTPDQYFFLINPTGGGNGPDTVTINYNIFGYNGYGLEVGLNSIFHGNVDIDFGSNLRLLSGNIDVTGSTNITGSLGVIGTTNLTGSTNITGSLNVSGSITNNGVNLQSLMIAYSIALG